MPKAETIHSNGDDEDLDDIITVSQFPGNDFDENPSLFEKGSSEGITDDEHYPLFEENSSNESDEDPAAFWDDINDSKNSDLKRTAEKLTRSVPPKVPHIEIPDNDNHRKSIESIG